MCMHFLSVFLFAASVTQMRANITLPAVYYDAAMRSQYRPFFCVEMREGEKGINEQKWPLVCAI